MKKIIKNYYLEFFFTIVLVIQFYLDLQLIENQKWLILIIGILTVILSAANKIRQDSQLDQKIKDLVGSFNDSRKSEKARSDELIKEVRDGKEKAEKKAQGLEEQNLLIARLIKEGLITEKSIYKIIEKYKFFYLFCYQNVPASDKIKEVLGREFRNPTLEAIESLGFIKVGTRHNFYVLPFDFLKKYLRDTSKLEMAIRSLVKKYWDVFLKEIKEIDSIFHDKYIRENPHVVNCTYMLSISNFHEILIGYLGYNAFSAKFKAMLQHHVDVKKLKREISKKKHDINKFIKNISYDLFLESITEKDKQLFIDNEEKIKKTLKVKDFTDYKDKKDSLKSELRKYFNERKSVKYANLISSKSKKYHKLFIVLGINFD